VPDAEDPVSMYYSYLTSPRFYSPRWYHEGIATFLETWMSGGHGRAQGGWDEMFWRTMMLEGARPYDVVGLESEGTTVDFQVGWNSYLYGLRFVSYLGLTYGPDQLLAWFTRTEGSRPSFAGQFRQVYGLSLAAAWRNWLAWERTWQDRNLARIRQYPVASGTPLGAETLGSVSRAFVAPDGRHAYFATQQVARPCLLVAMDLATGQTRPLAEVPSPSTYNVTSLAYAPTEGRLFYTNNEHQWRDLYELDLKSGRTRRLIRNCRAGDLAFHPQDQSLWAIQHRDGRSTLVRIAKPYNRVMKVKELPYGQDLIDLDIAPDGRTLTATRIEINGTMSLVEVGLTDLLLDRETLKVLHVFPGNSASNFVHAPGGRYLFGTSYLTGVSNVFRFDLDTGKMEAASNAETGLFRPTPLPDGQLLAFRYAAGGFRPVRMPVVTTEDLNAVLYLGQEVVEHHPELKTWNAGSPLRVDVDKAVTFKGDYGKAGLFRLASLYPVVEGYKNTAAVGLRATFSDPLELTKASFTGTWSPDPNVKADERFHAKFNATHGNWQLRLAENATDFYDLFGPTKVSRKGWAAGVDYHDALVVDQPRTMQYGFSATCYGDIDTLPGYQNVWAPYAKEQTTRVWLQDASEKRTAGSAEPEYGYQWNLAASGNRVGTLIFPQYEAGLDLGVLTPLPHASLWLRSAAGLSRGDPTNPFAHFYFGGFGNNYVDWQETRRYRTPYSLPGLAIDQVGGGDYLKETLEWVLPFLRFSRLGVPGFYASWAQLAVFSSHLDLNRETRAQRLEARDLGAQLDLSLTLFSSLESTLSLGWAAGHAQGAPAGHEVMASLRIIK